MRILQESESLIPLFLGTLYVAPAKKLSIIDAIGHYSRIRKNITHREQKTEKQITEHSGPRGENREKTKVKILLY